MPPVGFEPTFSAGERPKTYALDRAATGTGCIPHHWFTVFREGREHFKTTPDVDGSQPLEKREKLQDFVNR